MWSSHCFASSIFPPVPVHRSLSRMGDTSDGRGKKTPKSRTSHLTPYFDHLLIPRMFLVEWFLPSPLPLFPIILQVLSSAASSGFIVHNHLFSPRPRFAPPKYLQTNNARTTVPSGH